MNFALYAIGNLESASENAFPQSDLPFDVGEQIAIERVEFTEDAFEIGRAQYGAKCVEALRNVRYALVVRYEDAESRIDSNTERRRLDAETRVANFAACLRLIRPTRTEATLIRGRVRPDGKFEPQSYRMPTIWSDVPMNQRLFDIRRQDAELLRNIGSKFHSGMASENWKYRMAVEFHEAAHVQSRYWKARFILLMSAVEAIFTTKKKRGSAIARKRINFLLGGSCPIYETGELSEFEDDTALTVQTVLGDLYDLRISVAHGTKTPDRFFSEGRRGIGGEVCLAAVMVEAASFIVRASLIKIVADGLIGNFATDATVDAYFIGENA